MSAAALRFAALDESTWPLYEGFHARPEGQGCFCAYWHFGGDNRAWQLRGGDENRDLVRGLVREGRAHGVLAIETDERGDEVAVGWLQCAPRSEVAKLTHRMPYRGLAHETPAGLVWSISCVRVREDRRRRGVARGLVRYALEYLRDVHKAAAVEAYPRRGDELRDDELGTGPEEIFVREGFALERDHVQYPVLRATLR